tara:strand:+ start:2617 stop:3198 length:582 start_codon:yes stop_codon:yes gene_type:complete
MKVVFSDIPDNDVLASLKRGEEKALKIMYEKYWKSLYISSYKLLKNKELSEDIIQDVFMDVWRNRSKIDIQISLKSYLYACVRYKVFYEFRKNKDFQRVELVEDLDRRFQMATPETKVMHKELISTIDAIVDTMPEKCKEVYKLSREEQLTHKEIATQLNISTKTVENHITKALKMMRTGLGNSFQIAFLFWL